MNYLYSPLPQVMHDPPVENKVNTFYQNTGLQVWKLFEYIQFVNYEILLFRHVLVMGYLWCPLFQVMHVPHVENVNIQVSMGLSWQIHVSGHDPEVVHSSPIHSVAAAIFELVYSNLNTVLHTFTITKSKYSAPLLCTKFYKSRCKYLNRSCS